MLDVAGVHFWGPYYRADELFDAPGVYVVLDVRRSRRGRIKYGCVDVGISTSVRSRVGGHNRGQCWDLYTEGDRAFAVLYVGDTVYMKIIEEWARTWLTPPCGCQ